MTGPASGRGRHPLLAPALLVAAAAVYLLAFVHRDWIPSDEGLLAHSAERVLRGELPHRDFDDLYTGGLSFLHALAMLVLGVKLTSLRWLLYAAALLSVPVVYRLAARVASPAVAAGVTAAGVLWTVPSYFASMPSWYNLFLTLGALWALLRHVDDGRRRWLFLAGVCTGASLVVKSSALLLIAAVCLFLVYREQQTLAAPASGKPAARGGRGYALFVTAGLGLFLAVLLRFLWQMPAPAELLHFFVPSACLCAVPLAGAWRRPGGAPGPRLARLAGLAAPFVAGVLAPAALFLLPYLARGGAGALIDPEVFFQTERLRFSYYALQRVETAALALPVALLLAWPLWRRLPPRVERRLVLPAAIALTIVLSLATNLYVYQSVWYSARPLPVVFSLAGSALLLRLGHRLTASERQSLFAALSICAVVSVSQFPFARGVYLCYVAPLVLLAGLYLVRAQAAAGCGVPQRLLAVVLGFYALFAGVWLNLGWIESFETNFSYRAAATPLDVERGGLRLTGEDARVYRAVVEEVRRRSPDGAFIYAAPDCPEIYFLTGRRNPTPSLFDFFEDDYGAPERTQRLLRLLEERSVDVVVLHWRPHFSVLPPDFAQAIFDRYPHRLAAYPRFTVHWRERAGQAPGQGDGPGELPPPGRLP